MPIIPGNIDFKPSGGGSPITSIQGGHSFECEVILDSTVTSPQDVSVSSNSSVVVFSATLGGTPGVYTVPTGSDRVTINCSAQIVSSNTVATVTASCNGGSVQGSITVTP